MEMLERPIKIKFENVGRSKFSETVTFYLCTSSISDDALRRLAFPDPDTIAEFALREARKHLASSNVECVYDKDKNRGSIFAGFHTVGHFSVLGLIEGHTEEKKVDIDE